MRWEKWWCTKENRKQTNIITVGVKIVYFCFLFTFVFSFHWNRTISKWNTTTHLTSDRTSVKFHQRMNLLGLALYERYGVDMTNWRLIYSNPLGAIKYPTYSDFPRFYFSLIYNLHNIYTYIYIYLVHLYIYTQLTQANGEIKIL